MGVELEGKELFPFTLGVTVFETPLVRPMSPVRIMPEMVGRTVETMGKVGEVGAKAGKFSPETKANFAKGNKMEAEQLNTRLSLVCFYRPFRSDKSYQRHSISTQTPPSN